MTFELMDKSEEAEQTIERLPQDQLVNLIQQQANAKLASVQSQLEQLKLDNIILTLKHEHNLSDSDSVNSNTGIITRA
jgi:hypothetical protein